MKLIINADDFGLSKSITDGIIEGIKGGYITSTSLMVNMPFAKYAIDKMLKNKMLIIPGFKMKLAKFFSRFVSDKFLLKTIYKIQRKKAS